MHMYTYAYMYMYTYAYIRKLTGASARSQGRAQTPLHACACVRTCLRVCTCACACKCACVYSCNSSARWWRGVHVHVRYTYIYIHNMRWRNGRDGRDGRTPDGARGGGDHGQATCAIAMTRMRDDRSCIPVAITIPVRAPARGSTRACYYNYYAYYASAHEHDMIYMIIDENTARYIYMCMYR